MAKLSPMRSLVWPKSLRWKCVNKLVHKNVTWPKPLFEICAWPRALSWKCVTTIYMKIKFGQNMLHENVGGGETSLFLWNREHGQYPLRKDIRLVRFLPMKILMWLKPLPVLVTKVPMFLHKMLADVTKGTRTSLDASYFNWAYNCRNGSFAIFFFIWRVLVSSTSES